MKEMEDNINQPMSLNSRKSLYSVPRSEGKRALIAMSGGVDSSVSASLMAEAGYDCAGVTMKLFSDEHIHEASEKSCCLTDDAMDAKAVCMRLGIEHYVFDFSDEFNDKVIGEFVREYESGRTPNPCVNCNRHLKFDKLFFRAKELDADVVVTGHYARIERGSNGRYLLRKAVDETKDQSYVLYMMTQDQLARTLFPLGGMTKDEVRAYAAKRNFVNAKKHDSQDICFIPDGDYAVFLEKQKGEAYPEGDFIDRDGRVLGRHKGAVRYTLGQRKGLGLAMGERIFVTGKSMENNTVTVGPEEDLYHNVILADDVNWIACSEPAGYVRVMASTRYHQKETPATAFMTDDGFLRVEFDEPKRAMTPGQAVVLYDGDVVVGGGTIREIADE